MSDYNYESELHLTLQDYEDYRRKVERYRMRSNRRYVKAKVVDSYRAFLEAHDSRMSFDDETNIIQPYVEEYMKDLELVAGLVTTVCRNAIRAAIKDSTGKRGVYRDKSADGICGEIVDAANTMKLKDIRNVRKALNRQSQAIKENAKRVGAYEKDAKARREEANQETRKAKEA